MECEITLLPRPGTRAFAPARGADRQSRRGETMPRKRTAWRLGLAGLLVAAAAALALVLMTGGAQQDRMSKSKLVRDPDAASTAADTPGEGPIGGYDAYLSAERTY